jgi:hypothetical protein
MSRAMSRAVSRAVSRAMSRAMSRAIRAGAAGDRRRGPGHAREVEAVDV